jgi:predicted kinase
VKKQLNNKGGFWASRDAMRFSMVREDEPYFERENEVFNAWITQICEALANPMIEDIYIDATHLNDRSREKTLSRLPKENINKITNVVFLVPIETCLERNAQRTGREVVPEDAIRNMQKSFKMPKKYSTLIVDADGREIEHE